MNSMENAKIALDAGCFDQVAVLDYVYMYTAYV